MKRLIILTAITAGMAPLLYAQNTTYGGGNAPLSVDAGYVSDYSPGGTIVLSDGSVTLANNATYEHGNNLLQNSGVWASSGSLDLFLNAGSNTISGTTAPSFFNAQFNIGAGNTMAITNAQGVNVAGTLQFNNALTTTVRSTANTGALHFADGATYTGGNTDAQHVDGYVSKTGNDAFIFPVGSSTDLRTLSISAPAVATNQYGVAWIAGNPGTNGDPSNANALHPVTAVTAPIASVSSAGQWDWIPVSGTGAGLTITVSIPNLSPSGVLAADLRLVGWNGTSWVSLSSGSTASGNTEGSTLSGTMIAGITAIGIGSISTPLPVLFSNFDVTKEGCKAVISWSTAMEQNNDRFEVERSIDGRTFSKIGTVQSQGNSAEQQAYSFVDEHPLQGLNHYRIRQIDIDGKSNTTEVRSQSFDCQSNQIKVYPTITEGTVYVELPAGYEQAKVKVFDINGRQVNVNIPKDGSVRIVQFPSMAAGAYLLKIENNSTMETFKILYQP